MVTRWNEEGAFAAAAIEPARWPDALRRLAEATGSDHAQLIGFGPGFHVGFNWVNDADPSMYAAFDAVPPEFNYRVQAARTFPDLHILDERHYDRVRPQAAAYADLCHAWGIPHGCQTNLRDTAEGVIGLALLRSERTGRTNAAERALFDTARRAAAAAVTLQIALEQEGYRLIAGTFEAMMSTCFVMDRSLRVRAMTGPAEALLREGALTLAEGRLTASDPRSARDLAAALHALDSEGPQARRVVVSPADRAMLPVQLHRLPQREWAMGFAPFAIAVVTRPTAVREEHGGGLRAAFGLTGAETAIALMLAAGQDREAIRAARRISRETMRSHLRALFAKLGVRREAEAVRLLGELLR